MFGVKSELQLDAHNHLHWSSEFATQQGSSVALRSTSNKPSQELPSLFLPYECKLKMFVNTVTPQEFKMVSEIANENVKVGLGLHPWYVEESDLGLFEENLPTTRFIGEIGLDFSKKFTEVQKHEQLKTFRKVCYAMNETSFCHLKTSAHLDASKAKLKGAYGEKIAQRPSFIAKSTFSDDSCVRILSVHSFNTQGETREILKESGVLDNSIVIYHWFGDGVSELKTAIEDRCLFSVSERMLSMKKGAELVKMIPEEQLLFETDMPKSKGDFWDLRCTQESIISTWQKWMKMVNATLK